MTIIIQNTVSGFYAECPSKNMYVSGSIWTKSKFLGLSLGVHNIGSGKTARHPYMEGYYDSFPHFPFSVNLHLLDYDEVYTCNLPNAYGRYDFFFFAPAKIKFVPSRIQTLLSYLL